MNEFSVKDKVFVITGATGYLGAQMVKDLQTLGAKVAILSRSLEKAKKLCESYSKQALPFEIDIASKASIERCFLEVFECFGGLDVLVNNAYFGTSPSFFEILDEDWDIALNGTIKAVCRTTLASLPYLRKSDNPRIINITSMYGMVAPNPEVYTNPSLLNPVSYGVGKAAIIHYTKYAAMQLANESITVNAVSYGPFPNPDKVTDKKFKFNLAQKTMIKRIGGLGDVTSPIYFLAMPASNYITGQNIVVDGGWTSW